MFRVYGRELESVAKTVRTHGVHCCAHRAQRSEVMRWPLRWVRGEIVGDLDVPSWCVDFITDAIESIAICGYFGYRFASKGSAIIVPPEEWDLVFDKNLWRSDDVDGVGIVHAPGRSANGCLVRSSGMTSMHDTSRYDALEANLLSRDEQNSRHTVFTSITTDLRNVNGSTRQWFRSATADEAAGVRPNVDTDYARLIARRRDTVRELAEHTAVARRELASSLGEGPAPVGGPKRRKLSSHNEHMVTDGREFTSAPLLHSLTDGSKELDRVYTQIMLAYNVPPQIFGKNINTERHAASNRLTESAVQIFSRYCRVLRSVVGSALKTVTLRVDGESCVAFQPVLEEGVLEKFALALSPSFVAQCVSETHGVPLKAIDTQLICSIVGGDTKPSVAPGSGAAVVNRKEDVA